MSETSIFDLVVVGGGINGAGIARDAAGRGLSVLLVEQEDLASATSSRSSKLVHGGLRYLETFQFRLVREALTEREVLLKLAPHIIHPLRFILPHVPAMRPRWMVGAGLWLYDHLGSRSSLPASGALDLSKTPEGGPLLPAFASGFHYSDCWVEDMRLVVLNAVDAALRGATILTRTKLEAAMPQGGIWRLRLAGESGKREVAARALANAAGPWAGEVLGLAHNTPAMTSPLRLVKGSHIVVPRLHEGNWAYLCQNTDGRVVFFLPYENDFTLIGTTDVPFEGNPASATCSVEEETYLLDVAKRFFRRPPSSLGIVHRFAGVRALYDDGKKSAKDVTRDYVLKLERLPAPLLSVFGGKITTYRRLAEQALKKLAPVFPELGCDWTMSTPLPGSSIGPDITAFTAQQQILYPWLPAPLLQRWCRTYGSQLPRLVNDAKSLADLGPELAPGLYEIEADYLRQNEFAQTLDDMLWRRTRLGLRRKSGSGLS